MDIIDMPNDTLMAEFEAMAKWDQYDPPCRPAPSEYSLDELREEVTSRLDEAAELDVEEEFEDE